MKLKKLVLTTIISSLILSGCGGGSSTKTSEIPLKEGNVIYENNNLSIQIPKSWEIIDRSSFTSSVPTETIVGFRNNIKSDIFTANVNISQKQLEQSDSPQVKDFAKSSMEIHKNNLIGYQLLNEKESGNSYFTEFEGKKSASEQIIHFRQMYVIKDNLAYTITGAYLPNEDESIVTTIGEMLDSFSLK